jgi:S1-C subfamily serine protease
MKIKDEVKQGWGTCSGVYVSSNHILTANHCVDVSHSDVKIKEVWVRNVYGDSAKATIVRVDPVKDLALLDTDLNGTPAHLASSVEVGEDVYIVGNPLGLEFVVTKGIVSSMDVTFNTFPRDHFITDATVLPGNSGGPCFDKRGRLIGIVVMSTSFFGSFGASGLGIAVQIDDVRKFLKHK